MNDKSSSKSKKKYFFRASAKDFMKIPSTPVCYFASNNTYNLFLNNTRLEKKADVTNGLFTCNNELFVKNWHEVSRSKIDLFCVRLDRTHKSWYPYNKGGEYRKYYGNSGDIVFFADNGLAVRSYRKERGQSYSTPGEKYYFVESISWSFVSSSHFGVRYYPKGFIFDIAGSSIFPIKKEEYYEILGFLTSKVASFLLRLINPTLNYQAGNIKALPMIDDFNHEINHIKLLISLSKVDWDSYETSWDFTTLPLLHSDYGHKLQGSYEQLRAQWQENTLEMQRLEEENNRIFIEAYGLEDELTPEVPLNEITLTCNPHYRYRLGKQWDDASEVERNAELERQLQSDTICELISYIIGCMMGRYSIDQPGLILASQGERLQDYLQRVPNPRFMPDDDAIVPLTDQEWFGDDATHRVREFVRTVWGEQHLQENLDFIAESLCLSAMRPRKGESSLDCIRRYLSTQFYKDHMRTYKKRPIYWLFSSGKLKAFECLVYLHRYNEGTLSRMRTEYVIPLTARLHSHGERLEEARANSTSAAETKRLEKELDQLHKQQAELAEFDEQLRHYADQRIRLDLDDGVKVNYGKFGNLLADVKTIAG